MIAGREPESGDEATSELAVWALGLSIVWLFGLGSIAGMVLGHRSLREIDASGGRLGGRSLAVAALVVGAFGLISLGLAVAIGVGAKN